jgi:hypothetical protein
LQLDSKHFAIFAPNRAAQEHAAKQRPNKSRICVLCHAFVRASIAQSFTGTPVVVVAVSWLSFVVVA